MNGYKNEATYQTVLHLSNDRSLYEQTKGRSEGEIKAFVVGMKTVADASTCKCLLFFKDVLKAIGSLDNVCWSEVAEAMNE